MLAAPLVVVATLSIGATYALFMVFWMHAPPLQVVALTLGLSVPPLLLAWVLGRGARRFGKRRGDRDHA